MVRIKVKLFAQGDKDRVSDVTSRVWSWYPVRMSVEYPNSPDDMQAGLV